MKFKILKSNGAPFIHKHTPRNMNIISIIRIYPNEPEMIFFNNHIDNYLDDIDNSYGSDFFHIHSYHSMSKFRKNLTPLFLMHQVVNTKLKDKIKEENKGENEDAINALIDDFFRDKLPQYQANNEIMLKELPKQYQVFLIRCKGV